MNALATINRAEDRLPPKLAARSTGGFVWGAVAVMIVAGGVAVLFCFDPAECRLPFCFFHLVTGLHCPGCGGTRALHQLLHGNLAAALRLNALLVVLLPLFASVGIRFAAGKLRRRPAGTLLSATWIWLLLASALVFGVLRNLPAFAWLSP